MTMRPALAALAFAPLTLASCGGNNSGPTGPRIGDITIGIYDVTVESKVDTCMPARSTMSYQGAIRKTDLGVTIPIPEPMAGGAVVLRPYEVNETLHLQFGRTVDDCYLGDMGRELTVDSVTADTVEVTVADDWASIRDCEPGAASPLGPCVNQRLFRFALREACGSACMIKAGAEVGTLVCECSGSGSDGGA